MATSDDIFRALAGFGAGGQGRGQQFLQQLDENRKDAMVQDAFRVNELLKAGEIGSARDLLLNRVESIDRLGGSPDDTLDVLNDIEQGNIGSALTKTGTLVEFAVGEGLIRPAQGQMTAGQREFAELTEGFTPEEVSQTRRIRAGLAPRASARETVSEAEERAARTTAARGGAKGRTGRLQGFVDTGVQAADATAITRRGLELLDDVKTGGIDAASLRAKQIFGIEGADEAELSTNLGKAVLSQLRATFGAAFTAKEGEQLQRIEAGFGKSTAGNKRLLGQALKISERAANRGVRAARELGDDFAADEIQEALKFTITPQERASAQAPTTAAPTGRLVFNPATGQLESK